MDKLAREFELELGRLAAPTAPPGAADMAAIVRVWPGALGAENARRAWPARVARDGTLHVHAADSVWAFQLGMLAEPILARLREHLGAATPQALRFVPGPIPEPPREAEAQTDDRPSVALEDTRRAEQLAAGIDDEELRELVARAAAASLAKARADRHF